MISEKTIASRWTVEESLMVTHLSGILETVDIQRWIDGLENEFARIESGTEFKMLVNLYGFTAADFPAHKKFRVVMPEMLAACGWRIGYLDLFEEARDYPLHTSRNIKCIAAAHVHQDETKIARYQRLFGREDERFFTNPREAERWIKGWPILR